MNRAGRRLPSSWMMIYALAGLLLGGGLTLGGYLYDYHSLYGKFPDRITPGLLSALHAVTPVHYFTDLLAVILAAAAALAGWLQDRVALYSTRLEEIVQERTRDLARSEQRYALAVEGSNDGIWEWDLIADQVYYSSRWAGMIGCKPSEVGVSPAEWFDRVHDEDIESVRNGIRDHLEHRTPHLKLQYRMRHSDGSYRWMLARGATLRDADGRPVRLAGSQADIHERRLSEDQLRHLALHDKLTGLPNRTLLSDRMDRLMARGRRGGGRLAVLHAGVDRFRKINVSLGAAMGDRLLVAMAGLLTRQLEEFCAASQRDIAGSAFRLDGDEFAIVLEDAVPLRDVTRLADRILRALADPIELDGQPVRASLSIGIALASGEARDGAEILRDAQTAMNRAKLQGRSRVEVFDREMLASVQEEIHLETELFQAIEENRLVLWYQPVVDLRTRRIAAFEALIRWEHPTQGVIPPDHFIPLAEATGLIVPMSRRSFEQAFLQLRRWTEEMPDRSDLAIKLNVSPRWLFHPDLEADLGTMLRRSGADPARIHLEITESCFIDRPGAVAEVLRRLKGWGFRIVLDDFGTGYSSMAMLHTLPFDSLKLDKSFVAKLLKDPGVETIVSTIITLGRKLQLDVVAEGIETRAQLERLKALRCDYGQGFLFGRPMRAGEAEELLRTQGELGRQRAKLG